MSATSIIRETLATGDRVRRTREASRQVWRAAPALAGASLALAGLSRWTGLPLAVPAVFLATGMGALIAFVLSSRRRVPVSDAAASIIDRDAGMHGELRSANWFARRDALDDWASLHVARAAARLQQVDWTTLYPRVRAVRAQLATAVLIAATVALTATMPDRARAVAAAARPPGPVPARGQAAPAVGRTLDPELQKLLEELLAAASSGTLPTADAMAADRDMKGLLDKLNQLSDAELLDALKRALAASPDAATQAAADTLRKLAADAQRAADQGTLPRELQHALEKLSDEMALARSESPNRTDDTGDTAARSQPGQLGESGEPGAGQELSIQFAKAAEAGGGAGVMMASSPDASQSGGAGGSGMGGSGADDMSAAAQAIEAALKKETVEASQDDTGKNVEAEIRRETEHGNATVAFTGSAAATFDRARAAAPPPVPEARRSGVRTYFVRKP